MGKKILFWAVKTFIGDLNEKDKQLLLDIVTAAAKGAVEGAKK
jgi:hypothetical protein